MDTPIRTRREVLIGLGAAFTGAIATYALTRLQGDSELITRVNQPNTGSPAPVTWDTATKTEIYASKLTAKNFPIIKQMADWTQGRIKAIYVISPEDFNGKECIEAIRQNKKMVNGKASISQTLARLSDDPQLVSAIQQEVRETFSRLMGEEIMLHINDQYIKELPETIINGQASCGIITLNAADDAGQIAIITTPYADMTKGMFFFQMLNIPADQMENLEGTDDELRTLVLMHEARHATERHVGQDLSFEIRADKGAALYWMQEIKKGNVTTPGLPEFWQRMRAMASIITDDNGHATNAAIQSGAENNAPISSDKIFTENRDLVIRLTREEIRSRVIPPTHFASGLHNLLYNVAPYADGEKIVLSLADEKIIREILASIANTEWTDLEGQFQRLSQPVREQIQKIADTMSENAASMAMKYNHPLLYAVIADLQRNGTFRDNPIADQYAWEFLEAVKRHAPKYFKVADYQENQFTPSAFDENGQPTVQHLGLGGPR